MKAPATYTTRRESLEAWLVRVLGDPYGGPALGREKGEFVLYGWWDAPVGWDILARGKTLAALRRDWYAKRSDP